MDKREHGQAVTFFRPSWGDSQERQTSLSQGLMVADPAQSYTILRDNSCHVTFFLKEKRGGFTIITEDGYHKKELRKMSVLIKDLCNTIPTILS